MFIKVADHIINTDSIAYINEDKRFVPDYKYTLGLKSGISIELTKDQYEAMIVFFKGKIKYFVTKKEDKDEN